MSIKLEAPYPGIQTITYLPSPEFNDSEGQTHSIQKQYTMRGDLYTYVKTSNTRRKLIFNFIIDRMKGLELRAFIRSYYRSQIKLTDHLDNQWIGKLTSNPFELSTSGPSELQEITLEFEGIKI